MGHCRRIGAAHGAQEKRGGQEWLRRLAVVGRGFEGGANLASRYSCEGTGKEGRIGRDARSRARGATMHPRHSAMHALEPPRPPPSTSSTSFIDRAANLYL